ncbi:MAG: DUF1553 domain-containing protein [Rubripirellula sp.]|nr:DUF1553 domain-containing protein [Rubripirellula sp.]
MFFRSVAPSIVSVLSLLIAVCCSPDRLCAETKSWPFRPVSEPAVPTTARVEWKSNDVDSFIQEKLEEAGIDPAPLAGKTMLARRLYLDLIGLPPTPDELATYLADTTPGAYGKLVNQLLDDPRYGEHWARFWLDLARYADTAGYEGDPDLPHAWRYRDYVIDSLNRDKPYDQFIREQLAGDELIDITGAGELPNPSAENLVALTFLRLAPFTEPRGDESRHEMLSEMTSTVGSVLLGLTVGCAKCHDHKYDPIPIEDFYRMKAFFATVQIPPPLRGDAFQIGGPTPTAFYRKGEADWAARKTQELRVEAETAKQQLPALVQHLNQRLGVVAGFGIQSLGGDFGNDYFFDQRLVTDDQTHITVVNANNNRWVFFTDARFSTTQGSLAGANRGHWYSGINQPTYASLGAATNGHGKPEAAFFNGRLAHLLVFNRPLTEEEIKLPVSSLSQLDGLRLWLDAADLDGDPATTNSKDQDSSAPDSSAQDSEGRRKVEEWRAKVGQLTLRQSDPALQPALSTLPGADTPAVKFEDDFLSGDPRFLEMLKDTAGSVVTVFASRDQDESYLFEIGGEGQFIATFVNPTAKVEGGVEDAIADATDDRITAVERRKVQSLRNLGKFLPQQLKRLQPMAMTLRHSIGPPYEPGVPTSRVMLRGYWNDPGEEVEPGFLSAITGDQAPAPIRLDTFKRWPTRSRRKALADWIASPSNPLTARVIVNRLWYRHFGRGIVETPSDFGALSEGPSHEALLDYLANKLIKNQWSLKSIQRLICNSSTYRQVSVRSDDVASQRDPDNILLWRYPVRRLGAEVVRDRILHASGRLNEERFGLPIFPPLPDAIEQRVRYDNSKWATQYGPEGRKRSIYIYQQRTLNMPMLQVFDAPVCDQSRPKRLESTTPLQALALYNGPLVTAEVPYFADRVITEVGGEPVDRIGHAIQIAWCRNATPQEIEQLSAHYSQFDNDRDAMISVCRILLNSSEFLYLN